MSTPYSRITQSLHPLCRLLSTLQAIFLPLSFFHAEEQDEDYAKWEQEGQTKNVCINRCSNKYFIKVNERRMPFSQRKIVSCMPLLQPSDEVAAGFFHSNLQHTMHFVLRTSAVIFCVLFLTAVSMQAFFSQFYTLACEISLFFLILNFIFSP